MHIVMIGPFGLRPRSTMRVRALPLACALAARGHRLTLLLPPWQNPEDAGRTWTEEGVRVENVPLPSGPPGWFHLQLTAVLVRRAQAHRPDIIHLFKPKAYAGLAHLGLRRWAKRHHIPLIVDSDDWEGPGGWNTLAPYPAPLRTFFTWQERWGLRHADALTLASRALQTLTWAMGIPPHRTFYLPNGFIPFPMPPKPPASRPTLLLYTRFFEFSLTRLWHILRAVRERVAVRTLVVGRGFFGEERRLLTLARQAGWRTITRPAPLAEGDLVYAGYIEREDLPAYLAAADVALYPFEDTLINRTKCPVKLLELLAAGIPVVGEAVGEVRETIRHGETGLLIPPADDAAMVEALVALLRDPAYRHTLGQQAAADMRERRSWEILAPKAEAAYRHASGL